MITLCGFSVSNYYNKVKMVLLEKQIPFTEEKVYTNSKDEAVLSASPLAKVPFIKTEHGTMCESQVIVDYLETSHPQHPLLPADPWQAAKLRELTTYIELHLELVARELYGQAFFGRTVDDATKARVQKQLVKNIEAFKRLAKFGPYVGGNTFTLADCAAWVSLPLVGMATKVVLGADLLMDAGVDWKAYNKLISARESAVRVNADRKVAQDEMAALNAKK